MPTIWLRRTLLVLSVAALATGCSREPRVAVVGLAGIDADSLYLGAGSDSVISGPHPVRVVVFRNGQASDAYRSGLQAAQKVVAMPGLVAVVGYEDSRSTLVVGPVYRDAGVPLIVPNATSRAIEHLGPRVFMMAPDNGEEGAFLARVAARGLGARRVTIFHLSDEYGIDLNDGVRAALDSAGITVLDDEEYGVNRWICPGDFAPLVEASLLRGVPDVVILGSRTRDARCIIRLFSQRVPSVRFLTADGVNTGDSLTAGIGPAASRVWVTHFWSPEEDSASRAFARRYERRTGSRPDQAAALRWDGVHLAVKAVEAVGADRGRVARYLRSLGHERPPYHGISGEISFGPGARHPMVVVDAWGHPVPRKGW